MKALYFCKRCLVMAEVLLNCNSQNISKHCNRTQRLLDKPGSWDGHTAHCSIMQRCCKGPECLSHVFMVLYPTMSALAQIQSHSDAAFLTQHPSRHVSSIIPAGTDSQELSTAVHCYHSQHLEMNAQKRWKESKKVLTSLYLSSVRFTAGSSSLTDLIKHLLPNLRPKKIMAMQK